MLMSTIRSHCYLQGHGVIDHECMLGLRVDAHPASINISTDALHFCMPGPPDYAMDNVLRVVFPKDYAKQLELENKNRTGDARALSSTRNETAVGGAGASR